MQDFMSSSLTNPFSEIPVLHSNRHLRSNNLACLFHRLAPIPSLHGLDSAQVIDLASVCDALAVVILQFDGVETLPLNVEVADPAVVQEQWLVSGHEPQGLL